MARDMEEVCTIELTHEKRRINEKRPVKRPMFMEIDLYGARYGGSMYNRTYTYEKRRINEKRPVKRPISMKIYLWGARYTGGICNRKFLFIRRNMRMKRDP